MKDLDDPTNRDTVPAMLTEGEFVLNKEAVQMYGPIIEQMNNAGLAARAEGNAAMLNSGEVANYNVGGLVDFLRKEEGWRDKAYKDSGGVWTIGYGRTYNADGTPVKAGQTTTKEAEETWLSNRARSDYNATKTYLDKHGYDYNEGQLQALASFRYNGGHGMLEQLTGNGTRDMDTIKTKMPLYNKVTKGGEKVEVKGLTNRRNAELGLWGGTASKPESQAAPEEVIDVSPSAEAGEASLMPGFEMPSFSQPQMHVPNLSMPMQAPEYIPSVTEKTMKDKQQPGYFNDGGFIGWLGDALFGDEEEKKRRAAALARRPGNRNFDPLQGYMGVPEQPAVPGGGQAPNMTAIPADPTVGGFNQMAPELNNRIQMIHNIPSVPDMPAVEAKPPVPAVTPDAAVNEQLSAKQQWDRLKSERDALPKGDPRRVELSNLMNKINVANAPVDPRAGLASGAANAAGIPEPEKVYSGRGEDGYYDEEERKYRLNEQLRQKQMQQAVTAPDAPGKEMVDAQVEAIQSELDSLGVPPESQGVGTDMRVPAPGERPNIGAPQRPGYNPEDMTAVPGIDTNAPDVVQQEMDKVDPDLADPRKESTSMLKSNPALAGKTVQDAIDKHGETPSEELISRPVQEVADAGAAAIAKDPGLFKNVSASLKDAFGDLFDSKELARMAVVFAGAMLTGASAGQALAYAGGMYMQRVDARANQYDKLVVSGKYTPESLRTYKESQDLTDLVPVGATPTMTGEFEKMYTESGKEIVVQKAKVGDNTIYVDENGRQVNPYKLQNMSKEDRHQYIKTHSGDYAKQIEEFRKQYDIKDDYSVTDISPHVNGKEVAEWALKNGIDPAEMGPLLDSALHEAVNDRRQDGSRARSVVPYLNQLVIRQKVPGGADLFTVKPADEEGPAQYVNAAKVQKLNTAAGNKLKSMGHKGGTQDLANIFYTEAAKDWNALPEPVRKQWNKRAGDDVNGFYLFVEDMLINN